MEGLGVGGESLRRSERQFQGQDSREPSEGNIATPSGRAFRRDAVLGKKVFKSY